MYQLLTPCVECQEDTMDLWMISQDDWHVLEHADSGQDVHDLALHLADKVGCFLSSDFGIEDW